MISKKDVSGNIGSLKNQVIFENENFYFLPRHIKNYSDNSYIKLWRDNKFKIKEAKPFKFLPELREAQEVMSRDLTDFYKSYGYLSGIVHARPAVGKCQGINTPILMYDCSIKMIQDIIEGDLLMGVDGTPRIANGITSGFGDMYKVIPLKGESFTCNADHLLSLKSSFVDNKKYTFNSVTNISIRDYLASNNRFKAKMKLWRTGIEFKEVSYIFDPYLIGIYLGDGTKKSNCRITINDDSPEILGYLEKWCIDNGYDIGYSAKSKGCSIYNIIYPKKYRDNPFGFYVKTHCLTNKNERNIPFEYLINSRKNRLALLAGLIDTDGHLCNSVGYEIVCKDEHFADQVVFLCRSLGFACYKKEKIATIKEINFIGIYYKLYISGDTYLIPCKVKYKKASFRSSNKNVLKVGFKVEYIGKDYYYGFNLDKDHLYLMGDFTVTHNTILTIYMAHLFNLKTLFIMDNKKIVEQWTDEILQHTDLKKADIGLIKGDKFDVEDKTIIISTPQTLSSKFKNDKDNFYPKMRDVGIGLVAYDECHKIANVWASGLMLINTPNLIGLSATPFHEKEKAILMHSTFGDVVTKYGDYDLKPNIKFIKYDSGLGSKFGGRIVWMWENNFNAGRTMYNKALTESNEWASLCISIVKDELSKDINNRMIVIVFSVNQLEILYNKAIEEGLNPIKFFSKQIVVNKEDVRLLFATQKYASEAFSYKELNRVLISIPVMGKKSLIQIIGRILRDCEGKSDAVVYDLIDTSPKFKGIFNQTINNKLKIIKEEYSGNIEVETIDGKSLYRY